MFTQLVTASTWRTRPRVPRSHSCERQLFRMIKNVETSLDTARKSACATIAGGPVHASLLETHERLMLKLYCCLASGTSKYPKYETTRLELFASVHGGYLACRRAKLGYQRK
jgi:hypothetical protein